MTCIYNDFNGFCELYDPDIEYLGHDDQGICICDDDPDSLESCENYEEL